MASKILLLAALYASLSYGLPTEKRADDTPSWEAVAQKLASDISALEAKLAAQENEIQQQKNQIQQQKNEIQQLKAKENQRVSFTAYVTAGHSLPATAGEVIRFAEVVENTGNAYSPHTGAFTVPYDGVYSFLVSIDVTSDYGNIKLEKNGQEVVWGDSDGGIDHITTGAVLSLQAGDVITVNHRDSAGSVDEGKESLFVGYRVW